jgi:hypothetical protein
MCATRITRNSETDFTTQQLWDTVTPRLLNFAETPQFSF